MNSKDYYNNAEIMNNILNSMRFRTNAFLNVTGDFDFNIQNVVVSNTSHILKNMIRFYFYERNYNIYSSVARYDFSGLYKKHKFPPFSFNINERKKQGEIFNKDYNNYIIAYDFVMDFDPNIYTYKEVSRIKKDFDIFKIPYILRFSGRGFHIIIPYKFLPEWLDKSNPNLFKHTATVLKKIYDLSSLDLAIYDGRRVLKTAYSIDERSGNVCLPLTDLEFERFNPQYTKPENVIKMPDLYYRNALLRHGDNDGFGKFLNEKCGINGQSVFIKKIEQYF